MAIKIQTLAMQGLILSLTLIAPLATFPVMASANKASAMIGQTVLTPDGARIGQVEDFAVDLASSTISFVVVAVGSFLIEDSLIAVHPDAFGYATDGEQLVVYSDNLQDAQRFGFDAWPNQADVLPATERPNGKVSAIASAQASQDEAQTKNQGFSNSGTATITNGRRKATVEQGKREISAIVPAESIAPAPVKKARVVGASNNVKPRSSTTLVPPPSFERLDRNNNDLLGRYEIGAHLGRNASYAEIDLDDSGAIDRFEYEVFVDTRIWP